MKRTLSYKIKPMSLNKSNESVYRKKKGGGGFSSIIKSQEYRNFEADIGLLLNNDHKKLEEIAKGFIHGQNFLVMSYVFKFPRDKFLTKKGTINKRCADLDNLLKPLNDQIFKFLSKYNPEIDDSAIVGIKAMKIPVDSDEHEIMVELSLHESLNGISIY